MFCAIIPAKYWLGLYNVNVLPTQIEITPAAIRAELRRQDFIEIGSSRSGQTWQHISKNPEFPAVLVPHEADKQLRGYQGMIESVVMRLAIIKGVPQQAVIDQLISK